MLKRMHQRCFKRFASIGLAIAAHAFDFMANLNINSLMSRKDANKTSKTHTSLLANF
jgi:hypothetical protein